MNDKDDYQHRRFSVDMSTGFLAWKKMYELQLKDYGWDAQDVVECINDLGAMSIFTSLEIETKSNNPFLTLQENLIHTALVNVHQPTIISPYFYYTNTIKFQPPIYLLFTLNSFTRYPGISIRTAGIN